MIYTCSSVRRAALMLGLSVVAITFAFQAQCAHAQLASSAPEEKWVVQTSPDESHPGRSYFIEFRGRAAANYGHLYVLYGRVNGADQIVSSRIAGLHPAGDAKDCFNCSLFNWTIGHLIPVPAETGASDGDLEEKYVTARYRVWLTAAEFTKVDTYIRKLQADNPLWNALFNNCVGFGRNIAEYMGLKMPAALWQEPQDFVEGLARENGQKEVQLPLKDAGSGAVRSASHVQPLPRQKPTVQPASAAQPAANPVAAPVKKKPVANVPKPANALASEPEGSSTFAAIFKREQSMTISAAQ